MINIAYRTAIFALPLLSFLVFPGVLTTTAIAEPQTQCATYSKNLKIITSTATAGTWANLRNSQGSLRYETTKLLGDAISRAPRAIAPQDACPSSCKASPSPKVIFSATPHKLLSDYSDKSECAKLYEQTTKTPFDYRERKFSGSSDLASWFNEFSQGSGEDGKDLYTKCYGSCSPRYSSTIRITPKELHTDTQVICGHARDKSDDTFDLEINYMWVCEDA